MSVTLSKDNVNEFITTDPDSVPEWWMCRKAKRQVIQYSPEAAAAEVTLPFTVNIGRGYKFDWRVYVANHRWCEELLAFGGIVKATATRHEVNHHYHFYLHCGNGDKLLLTENTLRRYDTKGEVHWMRQSQRAVLKAFDEALGALKGEGWQLTEMDGWYFTGNFNATIRDMLAEFFSHAVFGVALGDPTSSEWIKVLEDPAVISIREDPNMLTVLDNYDLRSRWLRYVRENFRSLELTKAGAKNLSWLKQEYESTHRPQGSAGTVSLKVRRSALLYPSPQLGCSREATELPSGAGVSLDLIKTDGRLVACDSGAFFLRVDTGGKSGYLRVSDAPYDEDPILLATTDMLPSRFVARRFTVEELGGKLSLRQRRPVDGTKPSVQELCSVQQPPARVPQQTGSGQQPPVRVPQQTGSGQQPPVRVPQQTGSGQEPHVLVPQQTGSGQEPHVLVPQQTGSGQQPPVRVPQQTGSGQQPPVRVPQQTGSGQEPPVRVPQQTGSGQEPHVLVPQQTGSGQEPHVLVPQQTGSDQQPPVRVPQQTGSGQQPPVRVPQQTGSGQEPPVRVPQQTGSGQQPPVRVPQQTGSVQEPNHSEWKIQPNWSIRAKAAEEEEEKRRGAQSTPIPLSMDDATDLCMDEIAVYRADDGVEVLRHGRHWKVSSKPEYRRGVVPPWRGLDIVLGDGQRHFGCKKITMRIIELERILSLGLTECDDDNCLCRVKYPGVVNDMTGDRCRDSTGFSSTGKHWDRGCLVRETACRMRAGDVVTIHLQMDGSGLFFSVLEVIVNGKLCPVALEAKRCGRFIIKGSGQWVVDLLLGAHEFGTPKYSDPLTAVTTPSVGLHGSTTPLSDVWQ